MVLVEAVRPDRDVDAIEWIRELSGLDCIEAAWRALEARVRHRSHVSTFDFLATWYRHYAGDYGGQPLVGLAWRGRDLAGLAPFTLRRGRVGRIPVRRVDFAPTDSIAGEFLVDDDRSGVISAFIDSLHRSCRFDVICLNGFDPTSPQLAALQQAATRHRLTMRTEDHAFAVVDLRQGYDAYRTGLSGHTRRNLSHRAKKIASAGYVVEGPFLQGSDAVEAAIQRMIAINEASYKLAGHRLADSHRGFLSEVTRRLSSRGLLGLSLLSIAGRDAAFILGVVERGCFFDITLAYDEKFAKLSPGTFLMHQLLQQLAAAGVHTVVSHGAHEYKSHWATAFVPQKRAFLFAPGPRGVATRVMRFELQPLWRRLRTQSGATS
jgi:CelD/BcsL family acetyltransferase involved in cellulose biosynthesis